MTGRVRKAGRMAANMKEIMSTGRSMGRNLAYAGSGSMCGPRGCTTRGRGSRTTCMGRESMFGLTNGSTKATGRTT